MPVILWSVYQCRQVQKLRPDSLRSNRPPLSPHKIQISTTKPNLNPESGLQIEFNPQTSICSRPRICSALTTVGISNQPNCKSTQKRKRLNRSQYLGNLPKQTLVNLINWMAGLSSRLWFKRSWSRLLTITGISSTRWTRRVILGKKGFTAKMRTMF